MSRYFLIFLCLLTATTVFSTTYSVNDLSSLNTAIDAVSPGDIIEMEDGTWMNSTIVFDANGTSAAPIILRAANPGQVILSGLTDFRIAGDYLIVSGLVFEDCTTSESNLISFRRTSSDLANHSQLTDCVMKNCNPPSTTTDYKWVGIYGSYNEVDHCFFENKNHEGPTIVVWTTATAGHHSIDHNYFGASPVGDGNGWETIRIGTSSFAQNDGYNTVEHNYFYQRDGEIEIISGKSSFCDYRFNIFKECEGGLTLRHGTDCNVEGNIFLGGNKSGSYGIRLIDKNHTVTNNYMEGLNHGSSSYRHPLCLMGGESNAAANGYQPNINNIIAYNTVINCTRGIMIDPDSDHDVPPDDCIIANNVVSITNEPPVVQESEPTNTTYVGNFFYRSDGNVSVPSSGYQDTDPEMSISSGDSLYRPETTSPLNGAAATGWADESVDFELQARSASPAVGFDEISTAPIIDRGIYGPTWLAPPSEPEFSQYSVLMEAEDAILGSNWTLENDADACGSQYMLPPEMSSTGTPPTDIDDLITFSFSLEATGTYKIFARTWTTGVDDDSFWVRANGGTWYRWNAINGPDYLPGYHWSQVGQWTQGSTADPVTFELNAGPNTVDFSWREEFARLDKIYVTQEDLDVLNVVRNNSINDQYSLKYTIENSCPSDTIFFADSTNNIPIPFDVSTIAIDYPLAIVGNGNTLTILDGENTKQLFINNSTNFYLKNIRLINGFSASNGGAIYNTGSLILSDVIFENNNEGGVPKAFTNAGSISIEENSEVEIKE